MSLWSDDPEWFDEWIEKQAINGRFGDAIRIAVEEAGMPGWEIWAMPDIDPEGKLGSEAMQDYCERFVQ
jgi:hypothetical protein